MKKITAIFLDEDYSEYQAFRKWLIKNRNSICAFSKNAGEPDFSDVYRIHCGDDVEDCPGSGDASITRFELHTDRKEIDEIIDSIIK
ncbi:MAG TPA: hypothetical protein DCZ94_12765 [Lentisphaeria bacterium]|nr:MAG: hypothetical protein A2X48_03320 [Lentisphaerae bacterium GWF2_49_21]HBC87819.1 hypothetical protein [Lentisphaeria bacterium]